MLTATWLLPVALLPMSWDAGDIYGPRLASQADSQQEKDVINTTEDKNDAKGKQKQGKKKSIFPW